MPAIEQQQTLAAPVSCEGVGLHSGANTRLRILPAEEHAGIVFKRTDVSGFDPYIAANFRNVTETQLGTTIANDEGTLVSTIEHLMSALWGCGIDNAIIELDGPEVPIMDGSSEPFVFLLECAGTQNQAANRRFIHITDPVRFETNDNKYLEATPAEHFSLSMHIDFDSDAINTQHMVFDTAELSFKRDVCRARTFGFAHEVEGLKKMGLARGGSLDNAIVIDKDKVLNKEGLRYKDEFARHKILDCIGDLYLAGSRIIGTLSGYRTGHEVNNKFLHHLFSQEQSWRYISA